MSTSNFESVCFSAQELAALCAGELLQSTARPVLGIAIDTRRVKNGAAFFALRGENTDGHRYLQNAADAGAAAVITEQPFAPGRDCAVILVRDTLAALGALGKAYKEKFKPYTVCITGSVGKTTTRQLLGAVFSAAAPSLVTAGNYNSEIGLPLTLLGLAPQHRYAILELGMNHAGEMARLSRIARPDLALITNIGTAHLEYLGSRAGIAAAKLEISEGMEKGSRLLIPQDEPLLCDRRAELEARGIVVFTVGEAKNSDFLLTIERSDSNGSAFSLQNTKNGATLPTLFVPEPGRHICLDAAFAAAAGMLCGISADTIRAGLAAYAPAGLRQKRLEIAGVHLIEDCYNASPESMRAALCLLRQLGKDGKTVAVLGDMKELGKDAPALHEAVGAAAAKLGIDALLCFGPLAENIAAGAKKGGMQTVLAMEDLSAPEKAAQALLPLLQKGDTVLFKASHSVAIERVADAWAALVQQKFSTHKGKD